MDGSLPCKNKSLEVEEELCISFTEDWNTICGRKLFYKTWTAATFLKK